MSLVLIRPLNKVVSADFPEIQYASPSTLNFVSQRNGGVAVVFGSSNNFGILTSNLSGWALASNLDTGVVQSNKWYYLYAVPASNGTFTVKASLTKPTYVGGLGPSGFSDHRYLGCIRTDASGNILSFFKDRGFYQFRPPTSGDAPTNPFLIYANSGTTTPWTAQLNGFTDNKYPATSLLVRVGANHGRSNDGFTQAFISENVGGTYYPRQYSNARAYVGNGLSQTMFQDCDLVNGLWQFSGTCPSDVTSINANAWTDGIREPGPWFNI